MNNSIEIEIATDQHEKDWQAVLKSIEVNHHAFNWKWKRIISETFSHKPYYLLSKQASKTTGILPLFLVKSSIFGKSLISLPYLNAGGPISLNLESSNALLDYAKVLSKKHNCKYTELRARDNSLRQLNTSAESTHKVAQIKPINTNAEELFASFPAKLRSQIRKPIKLGYLPKSFFGKDISDKQYNDFYKVFSTNMRDLGTPVYPQSLFRNALQEFSDKSHLVIVYDKQTPVAAGILIVENGCVEIPWASSLKSHKHSAPNMLLYWEALKVACDNGYKSFDFGRSTKGSGTDKFKQQWGTNEKQLYWHYLTKDDKISLIPDISPTNKNFSVATTLWKRLPISLANTVGPYITKNLP